MSWFLISFFVFFVFPRKILMLLALEFFFLVTLYSIFVYKNFSSFNFFFFIILLIFLVLDSVLGISIFTSIGRKSGSHSAWFL